MKVYSSVGIEMISYFGYEYMIISLTHYIIYTGKGLTYKLRFGRLVYLVFKNRGETRHVADAYKPE